MIGVINYGLGNIQAFLNIFKNLNVEAAAVHTCEELRRADRLILPGVGSFDWAMAKLAASGMRECLDDLVMCERRYVLGVCVGMQMMANSSEEGQMSGLAWIPGIVRRFDDTRGDVRIQLPHMGWNDVEPLSDGCLFREIESPRYYFLHSYCFCPNSDEYVLARTDYGGYFASAVRAGNIFGTQFHPEKSHRWGIQLLRNFAYLENV